MILGHTRLGEAPLAPEIDDYVKSVVDPWFWGPHAGRSCWKPLHGL